VAKINGRHLDESDVDKIKEIIANVASNSKHDEHLNPLHMYKGKLLCKTLIIGICWITVCFGYYALTLNATEVIKIKQLSIGYKVFLMNNLANLFVKQK
jgi:hypothetical protein